MGSPSPTVIQMALIKLNGSHDKTNSHKYGKIVTKEEGVLKVLDERKEGVGQKELSE